MAVASAKGMLNFAASMFGAAGLSSWAAQT
jgi:hypothetical protein